jgi:hypothetical protein
VECRDGECGGATQNGGVVFFCQAAPGSPVDAEANPGLTRLGLLRVSKEAGGLGFGLSRGGAPSSLFDGRM